jgi:hypothetical protein
MQDPERESLRDSEIALMDAIKSVIEIMLTANIAKPQVFNRLFGAQHDEYMRKRMPAAAAIMQLLQNFVNDPKREEHRQRLRQILQEPPKGSA